MTRFVERRAGTRSTAALAALVIVAGVPQDADAQSFWQRVNFLFGAGYLRVSMDPELPRDLINHQSHPEDAFLTGSPGVTDLQEITVNAAEIETGLAYRPTDANFALIFEYVLKVDISSSGRLEKQQENDSRQPAMGSFIYSQLTDVKPGHALRTGAAGAWRLSERRDLWLEVRGLVDIGRWDMTFEKGWSRHGSDQAAIISTASGFEVSPRARFAFVTDIWAFHATAAFTQIAFSHELVHLEPHDAAAFSIAFGANIMLPSRPRLP